MKEFYKIDDFIDVTDNNFALSGVSQLDGDVYTMASSADVLNEIADSFGERSIYAKETTDPFASFKAMWARWIARRGAQLASAFQVLVTEYNPLENYNRTETHDVDGSITHGEKITKSYSHTGTDNTAITPAETTVTTTPETETTVTTTPAETTKTTTPAETTETITGGVAQGASVSQKADASIYAFNSSSPVKISEGTTTDSSKSVKEIESNAAGSEVETTQTAGTEVTSYEGSDTIKTEVDTAGSNNRTLNLSDSGSDTHSGTDTTTEDAEIHAYGNIGTMSTQNMATQEIELRKRDFVYSAILEFINLYTVYA